MTKKKKVAAREKKIKRMLNAIGHYANWREMECPVRIIGVANPEGLRDGNVTYQGLREDIENCGMPIVPNENVFKERYIYIVELPEAVDIKLPDGESKKARALFIPKRELSSPIHPDLVEKIQKKEENQG